MKQDSDLAAGPKWGQVCAKQPQMIPIMIRRLALAAVLSLGLIVPAGADYPEGLAALERGDYAAAQREFVALAERGHRNAQFALGQMYRFGTGVKQDDAKALAWFRKAAEHGHADAQTVLGFRYAYGVGTGQDRFQAYFWFSLAALQGNLVAMDNRDKLALFLTAAQRAEADRLVAKRRRQAKALTAATPPTEPEAAEAVAPEAEDQVATATAAAPDALWVQLGAFRVAENAPAVWRRLRAAQPDLLGGLRHSIQRADRSERVFHLLHVGPLADAEAAKTLCVALTRRGVDCLVVKP